MPDPVYQLAVDHSESHSAFLAAVRRSDVFDVRMVHLATGDYLTEDEVLVERKSVADFNASLVDGRLFPQAARLAHSALRSLLLIDGPTAAVMPDVHPHSVEGQVIERMRSLDMRPSGTGRVPLESGSRPRRLEGDCEEFGRNRDDSCDGQIGAGHR